MKSDRAEPSSLIRQPSSLSPNPSSLILQTFFQKFDQFADAPDAVAKMRELVLDLAIQGKLVERKVSDGDGHSLLKRLRTLPPERNSKSKSPRDIVVEPEAPLEIPSHWALTTVENTTRETGFFCDGDWVETKDQDPDGDVRLIQLADVGDGQYRDRSSRFMTKAAAKRLNCSYLNPGDILVARMPDPLGRCCRFPGDSKPAVTVVDVCILRPNAAFFDPDFLVVSINSPRFRRLVSAQATGTTRSRISRSKLGLLPIPLPPLAEQKRIVAKVDELMALCDRLEAQQQERDTRHIALARAALARFADAPTPASLQFLFHPTYTISPADLRKSILDLAVYGKLAARAPDDDEIPSIEKFREAAASLANSLGLRSPKESHDETAPSFDVPDHWRWMALADLGAAQTGTTPTKNDHEAFNGNIPFIKPADILPDGINYSNESLTRYGAESGSRLAPAGSLLMVCIGTIGKCNLIERECAFNQQINSLSPVQWVDSQYLLLAARAPYFQDAAWKKSSSTTIAILNKGKWLSILVPIPPLAEQRRIVAKAEQLMALVDALETQLAASRATAANLLTALVLELTAQV